MRTKSCIALFALSASAFADPIKLTLQDGVLLEFSGQSPVFIRKGESGLPGGNAGERNELVISHDNPGANLIALMSTATTNALATWTARDPNKKERMAMGLLTNSAAWYAPCAFSEVSDIDWANNGTALPYFLFHTTNYHEQADFVQWIRMHIKTDGQFTINDRYSRPAFDLSSDGATLTLGSIASGSPLTAIKAEANLAMGNNKVIILDASGAIGPAHPKIAFSNGLGGVDAGIYSSSPSQIGFEIPIAGVKTVALSCGTNTAIPVVDVAGILNVASDFNALNGAVFSSDAALYLQMRTGGRPSNAYQWHIHMPAFGLGRDNQWELVQRVDGAENVALHFDAERNATFGGTVRLKGYTVSTLPAGAQGDTAYVTDATSPTYLGTLTGGGAVVTPVFHNGSAWVSH